jgi:hypothetical protein
VGFTFRSRATLECPNGEKIRPHLIDLGVIGIIWTINKKPFFLGIIENSVVQRSWSFVLTPLVHAVCFLVDCRASSAKNWHILRSTFYRCIQLEPTWFGHQREQLLCDLPGHCTACKYPTSLPKTFQSYNIAGHDFPTVVWHSSACTPYKDSLHAAPVAQVH